MSGAEQTSKGDMDYFQGGNYRRGEKMSLMTSSSFLPWMEIFLQLTTFSFKIPLHYRFDPFWKTRLGVG